MFNVSPIIFSANPVSSKQPSPPDSTVTQEFRNKRRKVEVKKNRFARLPVKLQEKVLYAGDFNPLELTRLRSVSKQFNRLVDSTSLWRDFCPVKAEKNTNKYAWAKARGSTFQQRISLLSKPMQNSLRHIWEGSPRCSWDASREHWNQCTHPQQFKTTNEPKKSCQRAHGERASWEEIEKSFDLYLAALGHPEVIGYANRKGYHDKEDANLLRHYIRAKPGKILLQSPELVEKIPTSSLYQEVKSLQNYRFDLLKAVAKTSNENSILRLCQTLIDIDGDLLSDSSFESQTTLEKMSRAATSKHCAQQFFHPWNRTLFEDFTSSIFFQRLFNLDPKFYFWCPDRISLSQDAMRCLISEFPDSYRLGPQKFFTDVDLAQTAVSKKSSNIFYVSPDLLSRTDFATAMLQHWSKSDKSKDVLDILKGINPRFRRDFAIAAMVLRKHGGLLKYFDDSIKKDLKSVALAIRSDESSFFSADTSLTLSLFGVGVLVGSNPFILPNIQHHLRFHPLVCCCAATAFLNAMRPHLAWKLFKDALNYDSSYEEARIGLKLASYLKQHCVASNDRRHADDAWYELVIM